ncbi:HAD-IIB family hydrolase [Lachnospiraceae bacterium ZAX-1]
MIFASDLDNTLIHSYKRYEPNDICIETKDGKRLSYMSRDAFDLLQKVNKQCLFVPVTTRSVEQYRRISLLLEATPKFAIVSNGAVLLCSNEVDEEWLSKSKEMIADCMEKLYAYMDILRNDSYTSFDVRLVDGIFLFTKTNNIAETMKLLDKAVDKENFEVSNLYEKIYIVPRKMNKGSALKRFIRKYGREKGECLLCAGDSIMDLSMLKIADVAVVPADFEFSIEKAVFGDDGNFAEFVLREAVKNRIRYVN